MVEVAVCYQGYSSHLHLLVLPGLYTAGGDWFHHPGAVKDSVSFWPRNGYGHFPGNEFAADCRHYRRNFQHV